MDIKLQPYRLSVANQQLTLGIDEDTPSILDAFTEEAANIGAEVSVMLHWSPEEC